MTHVLEEIRSYHFWKAIRTELLATMLLVFMGCGTVLQCQDASASNDIKASMVFGLTVTILVQSVGHVSGGHLNPAITLAMLVTRNISTLRCTCYIIAQCLGAIAGAGALYGIIPLEEHRKLGITETNTSVTLVQAFGLEFFVTFIYAFSMYTNIDSKHQECGPASLYVGFSVTIGHLLTFRYTGASMNPARSFGPAVVTNFWKHHWVYWVGPILGAIIGAFTHEYTRVSASHCMHQTFRSQTLDSYFIRQNTDTLNTDCTEMTDAENGVCAPQAQQACSLSK